MARNRNVSSNLWRDDKFQKLSLEASLVYVLCISMADDVGRLNWSTRSIANFVVKIRRDITNAEVERWMEEICASGLILVSEINGRSIGQYQNWEDRQCIRGLTPSRLPAPPGSELVPTLPVRRV